MEMNSNQCVNEDESVNELIANVVQQHPILWDVNNKLYRDNTRKNKMWLEIAYELQTTDVFVKTRWRTLRDRYMKERRKMTPRSGQAATSQSQWPMMAYMHFLAKSMESKQSVSMPPMFPNTSDIPLMPSRVAAGESMQQTATSVPSSTITKPFTVSVPAVTPTEQEMSWSEPQIAPFLSPSSSIDSQELSRPASRDSSGASISQNRHKRRKVSSEPLDPLETAILTAMEGQRNKPEMSSEEHFYMAIAKDAEKLSPRFRIHLRKRVIELLEEIMDYDT